MARGKIRPQTRRDARLATLLDVRPHFEPVSKKASDLGHFLAAQTDLNRMSLLRADIDAPGQAPHLEKEDVQDKPWLKGGHHTSYPQPAAVLSLYGKHYREYARQDTQDTFVCQLGVFPVRSGARIIQAHPAAYATLSSAHEYRGRDEALDELFDPRAKELERYARISLGIMDPDGELIETIRPFNTRAFGCNILPILHRLSDPQVYPSSEGAFIQICHGNIEEF